MNQVHSRQQEPLTFEKVWKMFQETDKKSQEIDKKIDKLLKSIGGINSSWKRLTEGFLSDAGLKVFQDRGIKVQRFFSNPEIPNICEYDLVFVNKREVVVMECEVYVKRTPAVDEVVKKLKPISI